MIEQIKELGSISLAIFESIFATKFCDFQDQKTMVSYFDKFDESILSLLEDKLKEQYEQEQVRDFLAQNPLLLNQNYLFISNEEKENFIYRRRSRDCSGISAGKMASRARRCLRCNYGGANKGFADFRRGNACRSGKSVCNYG